MYMIYSYVACDGYHKTGGVSLQDKEVVYLGSSECCWMIPRTVDPRD